MWPDASCTADCRATPQGWMQACPIAARATCPILTPPPAPPCLGSGAERDEGTAPCSSLWVKLSFTFQLSLCLSDTMSQPQDTEHRSPAPSTTLLRQPTGGGGGGLVEKRKKQVAHLLDLHEPLAVAHGQLGKG